MTGVEKLQVSKSVAMIVLVVVCITTRISHCSCCVSFICCGFSYHAWYPVSIIEHALNCFRAIETVVVGLYHIYEYIVCNSVYDSNGMWVIVIHCMNKWYVSTFACVTSGWEHVGMLDIWTSRRKRLGLQRMKSDGAVQAVEAWNPGRCWKRHMMFIESQQEMLI